MTVRRALKAQRDDRFSWANIIEALGVIAAAVALCIRF